MSEAQAMAVKGGMGNTFGHDKADELDGRLDQRNRKHGPRALF